MKKGWRSRGKECKGAKKKYNGEFVNVILCVVYKTFKYVLSKH
jgi:hypothetical protein